MKKYAFGLLMVLICVSAYSQKRPKYEDELPNILAYQSAGIPVMLKIYQADEPDNVSIDFQLAVVYLERFLNSDILTDFDYKLGNARNALLYLKKSRINLDEKEVRKNDEHYVNFGSYNEKGKLEVSYDTIGALMETYIPMLEGFVEAAPPIYENFTSSFSRYDQAHKLYTEIVGTYNTYNDLLMLHNEDLYTSISPITNSWL
jgi:hypothetical protein